MEVVDFLETYNVTTYPISLTKLATKMKVPLIAYGSCQDSKINLTLCKLEDSFLILLHGKSFIFFNDKQRYTRIRFSIAHEMAHIWLEHSEDTEINEAEANFFASYLLAPVPLILKSNIDDVGDVSTAFNVGFDAAYYAYCRAIKRSRISKPPLEYEQRIIELCSLGGGDPIERKE